MNAEIPEKDGPPPQVTDLAAACVRFVERATKVTLDFEPETLSVLDHWIRESRTDAQKKPEVLSVVAQAAGAYFGEVVRRRYASWWRVEGDPTQWAVEFAEVFLSFHPMLLVIDALRADPAPPLAIEAVSETETEAPALPAEIGDDAGLELEEADKEAVALRLAELPPVTTDEYYALTTRLEVIEVAVEAIRARRLAAQEPVTTALGPEDYDDAV